MKSISEIQGTPLSMTHIGITGVLDGEEKEKDRKKISEDTVAQNFPNVMKDMKEKTASGEFYIHQKYPSKMEDLRHFQIDKR